MIVLKLPVIRESEINHALNRAIAKAMAAKPAVRYIGDGGFEVEGSRHNPYTIGLNFKENAVETTCDCPAHTGKVDPNDTPKNDYIPRLCYHIAAVLVSLMEAGKLTLTKTVCFRCKAATTNTIYQRNEDRYECLKCISADLYDDDATVKATSLMCEDCKVKPATIDGSLCISCFDLMRYSDYAGASRL